MKTTPIPVEGLSDKYSITEDGRVYSHIRNKFRKGAINSAGYTIYFLRGKWYFAHRLVYRAYVGPIKHEINHIDGDKSNNHYSNLEDITHKENIRKARQRSPWISGREPGFRHSDNVKRKMAIAKMKRVNVFSEKGLEYEATSIDDAANYTGTYRKKVYRALAFGGYVTIDGHKVAFCWPGQFPLKSDI